MAVINITIADSATQIVSGIPRSVQISTNIPASIFYTLDETDPTISSSIYTGPIYLPTNEGGITLKIYATDGSSSSAIITKQYSTDLTTLRRPWDKVTGIPASSSLNLFPFGSSSPPVSVQYTNTGGQIVDSPGITNIPDGYDGSGTGTYANGTDEPLENYELIFSERNAIGERGHGIGTLPATVTVRYPEPVHPSTSSNVNDKFFNAKAAVIYQDSRDPPADPNLIQLNRQFFTLEDPERVRNGATLFNSALDGMIPTGSFLRAHFNPRENTITYYYFDSATLRWIISKELYQPKSTAPALFNIVFSSRENTAGFVFKWLPFVGRRLI